MAVCTLCKKRAHSGNAVSHSQIHTKRRFKPNLQKVNGLLLCTACLRTLKKVSKEQEIKIFRPEVAEEASKEVLEVAGSALN